MLPADCYSCLFVQYLSLSQPLDSTHVEPTTQHFVLRGDEPLIATEQLLQYLNIGATYYVL